MAHGRLGRLPTVALAVVVPLVALVTVVVTLNVTSDGTSSIASAGAGKGATTPNSITIANFQFSPAPLVVSAGTEVKVTNNDGTAHTVTAVDKSFDTGHLDGGASATITLAKAGTFKYFCDIHNYMTGTIEVK